MIKYLMIGFGAFLGANLRYVVAEMAATRLGSAFPYGTLLVNVSGSFAIGLFLALAAERFSALQTLHLPLVIGFLGAYTTFSALSFESLALIESRQYVPAASSVLGNIILGTIAVALGIAIGRLGTMP